MRWPVIACFIPLLAFAPVDARAADAVWTSRDYVDQYALLRNGKVPLPHLRDERQRALFRHLVDPRNVEAILDDRTSGGVKLQELRKILAALGSYRASYNLAVIYGEPLEQELADVQVYSIIVAAALTTLARQQGQASEAHTALATMVEGMIEAVADGGRYSAVQRTDIAESIAAHYLAIAPVLSAEDRTRLRSAVLNVGMSPATDHQRAAIARLKDVIAGGP